MENKNKLINGTSNSNEFECNLSILNLNQMLLNTPGPNIFDPSPEAHHKNYDYIMHEVLTNQCNCSDLKNIAKNYESQWGSENAEKMKHLNLDYQIQGYNYYFLNQNWYRLQEVVWNHLPFTQKMHYYTIYKFEILIDKFWGSIIKNYNAPKRYMFY